MRENINKIIAIAIGVSVISSSSLPVFAADSAKTATSASVSVSASGKQTQKKILTVQQAIDATIENSDKLKLMSKEVKMYRLQAKAQDKIDDADNTLETYGDEDDYDYDFPYDKLKIEADQTEQEQLFYKDQVTNDITSKYDDIVSLEVKIEKANKNIEVKTTQLNNSKLKQQLGLTIDTDVKSSELEIQTLKDNVTAQENNLKDKKAYLQVLTNIDLNNYSFDHSIDYKTFKIDGTIDNYVSGKLDEYLKYSEKLFNLNKGHVGDLEDANDGYNDGDIIDDTDEPEKPTEDDYKVTTTDPDTGVTTTSTDETAYKQALTDYNTEMTAYKGTLSGYETYLTTKYNVDSSKVTIDEQKKTLTNTIKGYYSTLLDYENQIAQKQEKIKLTNQQLEQAKLKYQLGLITKTDYDATVVADQDLDTDLRTLVNSYNILKDKIQKPWVAASSN